MNGFALLWSKTLDSSLWIKESKETRLVWMTLMMMKNSDGIIQASIVGLADRAKVSPDECRVALAVLLSPDIDDTSKIEEGRRLRAVPGGWQIVNHDLYRFSTDAKREFWRQQKAEQRLKQEAEKAKTKPKKKFIPSVREQMAEKASREGNDELAARIMQDGLPPGYEENGEVQTQ